jgi:hypothetical protein
MKPVNRPTWLARWALLDNDSVVLVEFVKPFPHPGQPVRLGVGSRDPGGVRIVQACPPAYWCVKRGKSDPALAPVLRICGGVEDALGVGEAKICLLFAPQFALDSGERQLDIGEASGAAAGAAV